MGDNAEQILYGIAPDVAGHSELRRRQAEAADWALIGEWVDYLDTADGIEMAEMITIAQQLDAKQVIALAQLDTEKSLTDTGRQAFNQLGLVMTRLPADEDLRISTALAAMPDAARLREMIEEGDAEVLSKALLDNEIPMRDYPCMLTRAASVLGDMAVVMLMRKSLDVDVWNYYRQTWLEVTGHEPPFEHDQK